MGQACTKKSHSAPIQDELEPEIHFKTYKSTFDGHYTKVEGEFNILQYFQLFEYLTILTNLEIHHLNAPVVIPKIETSTLLANNADSAPGLVVPEKAFLAELTKADFQVFLENKVMKNFVVFAQVMKDETNANIFKEFMVELFDALILCYVDLYKKKNPGVKVLKGQIKSLKKLVIISIGLLFCKSSNRSKVNFFFNLFLNENGRFEKSQDLEDFLFFLFIIPSTCSLRVVKKLGDRYEKITKIDDESYLKLLDAFEIKDILRLKDIFIKNFFLGGKTLTKTEFEFKFVNEDFGWIFSTNGIRENLEKSNDIKPPEEE